MAKFSEGPAIRRFCVMCQKSADRADPQVTTTVVQERVVKFSRINVFFQPVARLLAHYTTQASRYN